MLSANKPRMRSILKDSDSQWSRETLSNLLPSGSMSFTSKMSSNSTPAILCNCMKTRLKKQPGGLSGQRLTTALRHLMTQPFLASDNPIKGTFSFEDHKL